MPHFTTNLPKEERPQADTLFQATQGIDTVLDTRTLPIWRNPESHGVRMKAKDHGNPEKSWGKAKDHSCGKVGSLIDFQIAPPPKKAAAESYTQTK